MAKRQQAVELTESKDGPSIGLPKPDPRRLKRLKILGGIMTVGGIALFAYFVNTVGIEQVVEGIEAMGWSGFLVILALYFLRVSCRALAWRLSVHQPYSLSLKDTLPGVIMGEAMSSLIPLGPIISGTTKVLSVRRRIPLVVGFSSITTENLFYTNMTALLIGGGAVIVLRTFDLAPAWIWALDLLLVINVFIILFGIVLIIKQWHLLSELCEIIYGRAHLLQRVRSGRLRARLERLVVLLDHGRHQARLFENLFFDFYRSNPKRFIPIILCQVGFHLFGILEVWFILSRIMDSVPPLVNAFLLESVSRAVNIFFKLVPFVMGVDEAGANYVAETLAMGAGVGITLAIIRKGRILFWTAVGIILVIRRGLHQAENRF